jgi:hypothetical protein
MTIHTLAFLFFVLSFVLAILCQSANILHRSMYARIDSRSAEQKRIDFALRRRKHRPF